MVTSFHALISRILNIPAGQVERTIGLLGEGATIPFISRYRKEVTGGLDEVQIGNIKDQLDKLTELKKRKESILSSIEEQGKLTPEQIDSTLLSQYLATDFMPDPDLLIRTGGEIRLSNYLLWQCAYSELYFCDTYWPDFREAELHKAIHDYQKRERRFGKTSEQIR